MSWANELYQVYVTQYGRKFDDGDPGPPPIAQSTVNAKIEVTLNIDGSFEDAKETGSKEERTKIPVTEDSDSRTSSPVPMPYTDKLIYLAGDYAEFVDGKKKSGEYYDKYIRQLREWHESKFTHPAVDALYTYIEKGCLIKDLLEKGIFRADPESGKLDEKYKINSTSQKDVFIRFRINGLEEPRTWEDESLQEAFINRNNTKLNDIRLCYATGKELPVAKKHPKYIRYPGDGAKLISANDDRGYTYRGRFRNADEALAVSYDFSQKMHSALKWLIQRQGIFIGSMVLIVWASTLEPLPDIRNAAYDYDDDDADEGFIETEKVPDTVKKYSELLSEVIFGKQKEINLHHKVMILGLDAATTGRLSICFYSELEKSDFLQNLYNWHEQTACFGYNNKAGKYLINSFSVYDIVNYAFGSEMKIKEKSKAEEKTRVECNEEIRKENILRLIPCITQGARMPADIVRALVRKASNPPAFEKKYHHTKTVEIACGMIRKYNYDRGGITAMAYDPNETDRSYLYGCLLAIADAAENATYEKEKDKGRLTNARRYWNAFSQRPFRTWGIIEERLRPYLEKLGDKNDGYKIRYEKMLNEIMGKFDRASFEDNSALSPAYLLGYHHFTAEIYKSKNNREENE